MQKLSSMGWMCLIVVQVALTHLALAQSLSAQTRSPLDQYRNLKFPAEPKSVERGWDAIKPGWQDRVLLEFEVVNHEKLDVLRRGTRFHHDDHWLCRCYQGSFPVIHRAPCWPT